MQGYCFYCYQFDLVLKQLVQQYGFFVFFYILDGQGDMVFFEVLLVLLDVMQIFFLNILVVILIIFLVNVNMFEVLLFLQGVMDVVGFMVWVDIVLQMYGGKKGVK